MSRFQVFSWPVVAWQELKTRHRRLFVSLPRAGIYDIIFEFFEPEGGLKDANGFHVDVAAADYPQDVTIVRINVDNFEEAYEIFKQHGFKRADGFSDDVDTGSSKFAILASPTGVIVDVAQHIK